MKNLTATIFGVILAISIIILANIVGIFIKPSTKDIWINYDCTLYYPNGNIKNVVFVQPEDKPEPHIESTFFGGSLYIENMWTSNLPQEIYGITDLKINKRTPFEMENNQ